MLFQSNHLFNEMRKFVGHSVGIESSEQDVSLISLDTNETILVANKQDNEELYNHLIAFENDEIECVIYGDTNVSFETLDKNEVIVDYEEEAEE